MATIGRFALLFTAVLTAALLSDRAAAAGRCNDALLPPEGEELSTVTLYDHAGLSVAQQNRLDALLVEERAALARLLADEQRNRQALAQAVAAGADHESLQYFARREGNFVTELILLQAVARQRAASLLRHPGQPAIWA